MFKIITAKDGNHSLEYNGISLLSKYNPLKDIERIIPQLTGNQVFILFSDLMGYIHPILEASGVPADNIFIYEPLGMRQQGFHSRDMRELEGFLERNLLKGQRPELIVLPSLAKALKEEYRQFYAEFTHILQSCLENIKVSSYFSKVWFINYARNRLFSYKTYQLDHSKPKGDFPIVVCAAGPSLESQSGTLRQYREHYFLISVLSAYNSLLNLNVIPDAVFISDAGVGNILHGKALDTNIPLLTNIYASSALTSKIKNPLIFYNSPDELASPGFQLNHPSVSVDAGLVARTLSSGPVVFSGLDLCYPRGKSSHGRGYAFNQRAFTRHNRFDTANNAVAGFYRRSDLETLENGWTHAQFRIIQKAIQNTVPGAHYLSGGLELNGLHCLKDLSFLAQTRILDRTKISGSLLSRPLDKNMLPDPLTLLHDEKQSSRIFVREILQKEELDAVIAYYRSKLFHLQH